MSVLQEVNHALAAHKRAVAERAQEAREDPAVRAALLKRWQELRASIEPVTTPSGLELPSLALPQTEEPGEIARFLYGEGMPGNFPFQNGIYPRSYTHHGPSGVAEEPTRLFAGLGLAEDTNIRFHALTQYQQNVRLSTAFDGPTLYGLDSDHDGVFGKIGEGGVAIDTIEDMERLFTGFPLHDPHFSVSMTINGPAPIILAMYVAAARRRFGPAILSKLRGTVQADVLKEIQAQNEMIFPLEPALRFLTHMVAYTTRHMPRWYPISISGYHIAEAGATPVQQAAYTLSNGFTYVELWQAQGLDVDRFGPRLSFFLDCGLDLEYLALGRVCRKIWAIGMREVFAAGERAQLFRLHTQTSGRSLTARAFKNNLSRTAIELMLAYINATNSCHSNSADEPFTTPSENYVRLAANAQAILLEETGLFKHISNVFTGSPGMKILEQKLEQAISEEFQRIDTLGGVLAATEQRYQRSQIQASAYRYERQIDEGIRPIIGLNHYRDREERIPQLTVVRTSSDKKRLQIERLRAFKERNEAAANQALDTLTQVVERDGNVFEELLNTVEVCSLGQITERLTRAVGRFRPTA